MGLIHVVLLKTFRLFSLQACYTLEALLMLDRWYVRLKWSALLLLLCNFAVFLSYFDFFFGCQFLLLFLHAISSIAKSWLPFVSGWENLVTNIHVWNSHSLREDHIPQCYCTSITHQKRDQKVARFSSWKEMELT